MTLTYDNTWIVSRQISTLKHRSEADTSIECFGTKLDLPLISAPMSDVTNSKMAVSLVKLGCLGVIHRFQLIDQQVREYEIATPVLDWKNVACAIGVTGDYQERFKHLYDAGCRIFCLDTANGANIKIAEIINWIKNYVVEKEKFSPIINYKIPNLYLIAGNVMSREGYRFLAELGVDGVRVGIANGKVCETKTETGIFMPALESVKECVEERDNISGDSPLIICDGGIRTPADMCKALILGADLCIAGSIFAGTEESPGDVFKVDGKLCKLYRGASSFSVQSEYTGKEPEYNEGNETIVEYKGSVEKVIKRFKAGLQSSMSYCDSKTLSEFRQKAEIKQW